ncbi:MAG TPA: TraR/DksA C4-type zinc finger protein [Methylomirabilota bacterium]
MAKSRGLASEFRRRLAVARRYLLRAATTGDRPRGKRALRDLRAAEARLDAGMYGLCESCSRPISLSRLRASPVTRRCARCAVARRRRS